MRSHSVHYLNNSKMFKSNSIRKYILKSDCNCLIIVKSVKRNNKVGSIIVNRINRTLTTNHIYSMINFVFHR